MGVQYNLRIAVTGAAQHRIESLRHFALLNPSLRDISQSDIRILMIEELRNSIKVPRDLIRQSRRRLPKHMSPTNMVDPQLS